jgi:hypothetical protein
MRPATEQRPAPRAKPGARDPPRPPRRQPIRRPDAAPASRDTRRDRARTQPPGRPRPSLTPREARHATDPTPPAASSPRWTRPPPPPLRPCWPPWAPPLPPPALARTSPSPLLQSAASSPMGGPYIAGLGTLHAAPPLPLRRGSPSGFPALASPTWSHTVAPSALPNTDSPLVGTLATIQAAVMASRERERAASLALERERALGAALTTQMATTQRLLGCPPLAHAEPPVTQRTPSPLTSTPTSSLLSTLKPQDCTTSGPSCPWCWIRRLPTTPVSEDSAMAVHPRRSRPRRPRRSTASLLVPHGQRCPLVAPRHHHR